MPHHYMGDSSVPLELFDRVMKELAEDPSIVPEDPSIKEERINALTNCTLLCKRLGKRAQLRLFGRPKEEFRFFGNGTDTEPSKGFNFWCKVIRDKDTKTTAIAGTRDPSSFFKTLVYYFQIRDNNPLTLKAQTGNHIRAFTNVRRLKLGRVPFDRWADVPDFALLGSQIQDLSLECCTMTIDQLFSYLLRFDRPLERLILDDSKILPGRFTKNQTLPKFVGKLQLHFHSTLAPAIEFIQEFNKFSELEMGYDQILLDSDGKNVPKQELNSFLLKSRKTLKYLRVDSSWGPVDVSGLSSLKKLAIDSPDIPSLWPMVNDLPFNQIDELLFVVHFNRGMDGEGWQQWEQEWRTLDSNLKSHDIGKRNGMSPLRFRVIDAAGVSLLYNKESNNRLQSFTGRMDISVDDGIKP